MTPVRGLTTKWSVSCMPYFTGDPSGSWPFRTNTSVPTLVDSESGRPVGYPPASRMGGSFTLLPAGTRKERNVCFSRVLWYSCCCCCSYIDRECPLAGFPPLRIYTSEGLFIPLVNYLARRNSRAFGPTSKMREMSKKYRRLVSSRIPRKISNTFGITKYGKRRGFFDE